MHVAPLSVDSARLAILAIKQLFHGPPACLVGFALHLAFVGIQGALGDGVIRVRLTTGRTAVGEAGFVRLQLEFFRAEDADFYRERHNNPILIELRTALHALPQLL
jgi:hypothetical protein